jgi:hypothetical protein
VTASHSNIPWRVRITAPRRGGWRAWLPVCGRFEDNPARQQGETVTSARIESETRRGRDHVSVTVAIAVTADDPAEAVEAVWWAFRLAAADDPAGWDLVRATAEVRPGVARPDNLSQY